MRKWMRRERGEILRTAIQFLSLLLIPAAFSSAFAAVKETCEAFGNGEALSWSPFSKALLFLLLFTIVFGRYFCGNICTFGAVCDWIYKVSFWTQKKTERKLPQISDRLQRAAQLLKYVVLVFIIAFCASGRGDVVNTNSPWTAFSKLVGGELSKSILSAGGLSLLVIVVLSAFVERGFCRFFCPLGALYTLMPVLPFGQLRRNRERCVKGCSLCEKTCPVSLSLDENSLQSGECIRCDRCVSKCPVSNISAGFGPVHLTGPVWTVIKAVFLIIILKTVIGM